MRLFLTVLSLLFTSISFPFAEMNAFLKAIVNNSPQSVVNPTSVTVFGDFQNELGCVTDYQADCALSQLTYDASDDIWQGTFVIPAGNWQYKVALNNNIAENYGQNAQQNGANISFSLTSTTSVKFYYDNKTHWVTTKYNSVIAIAPGSFQSELGCPGDWQPDCLRSWLEDPDGNGIYSFETTALPAGNYETKVAINESWDENYGLNGQQNGANIPFTVPVNNQKMLFTYNAQTHILTVSAVVPSAATVSVSGHVTTANGRAIMNVRLSLTDSQGNVRTATTRSSGYYQFTDVQVGETYVLTVSGKGYSFNQPVRVLNINEEINEVNFTANSEKKLRLF